MKATAHVGPKGGTEYRLWTGEDTFRIVGRFAALPHMSAEEKEKADSLEAARKASLKAKAESDLCWRSIVRGG